MPRNPGQRTPSNVRVIRTKLGPPRPARRVVRRENVLRLLTLGNERTLTILRAPAGFGKTTALAEWREKLLADQRIAAWLTLDADDNDPGQFVTCLTRALADALGRLADHVPEFSAESETASPKVTLTSIINALDPIESPITLILDDYDRIHAGPVHDLLAFLLLHAPSNLHVVIATRSEPPLPLAYLRAHDELVEIDAASLRFGFEDTRRFFGEVAALTMDAGQTRALHDATEGWVAGLQIAAIALRDRGQDRGNAARLIAGFSGKFKAINEYLADAVLPSLDQPTVMFLLRTSILERFSGPLCEAVAGVDDGRAELARLHQQNFFLQSLDDEGGWYRYHALFGDFLRGELERRLPDESARLHERAASWFAEHELWSEAVRHALAADRIDLATQWVERCAMREVEDSRVHNLLAWVRKLPPAAVRPRQRLRIAVAWALLLTIQLDEAMAIVDDVLKQIDEGEFPRDTGVDAELQALRFCITALKDDTAAALPIGEQSLKHLPKTRPVDDHSVWVVQALLNGLTHCYQKAGRVGAARAVQLPDRYPLSQDTARNLFTQCYRASTLSACDLREAQLHQGARHLREALRLAEAQAGRRSAAATLVACSLASVHYEWNDLEQVDQLLADRLDIIDDACYLDSVRSAYLALARLSAARGDYDAAHSVLDRAELVATRRRWPRLAALCMAERVRLWLSEGRPLEAEAALLRLESSTCARPPAMPSAESETWRVRGIARARWLLHRRHSTEAAHLLEAVLADENPDSSPYPCARTRVLLAVALDQAGRSVDALDQLGVLLRIGEPAGMIRSIADEGAPIANLLQRFVSSRVEPVLDRSEWRERLFKALDLDGIGPPISSPGGSATRPSTLIEPLSKRERDVLTLVAQGLSNEQTARALGLGTETVKWHLKNVYCKLGVSRRTLAVHRARQMDLIGDDRS